MIGCLPTQAIAFEWKPGLSELYDKRTQVGPKTTPLETYCYCDHLTSFGSGFAVQPNAIDFAFVFSNADFLSNPTLYITEIFIGVLYIVLFIWARRQDKKDLLKV